MKNSVWVAGIVLAVMVAGASGAFALMPMWELDVECAHPRSVRIKQPEGDQAYWYVVYTITNQLDEEKLIRPIVTMTSNMGQVSRDLYEPKVLGVVAKRTGLDLANVTNAAGVLQPGQVRKCVAVFAMPDRESSKLTLSIYGAAGKRVEKQNGTTGIASRIYKVRYSILGDRYNFTPDRLKLLSKGHESTFRTDGDEGMVLAEAADAKTVKLPDSAGETAIVPAVGAVSGAAADLVDLLPAELEAIGYVNLRELADAGVVAELLEMASELGAKQGKDPAELLKTMRLDPTKDLDALAVGFHDFGGEGPPSKAALLVAAGKLDAGAIYKVAADESKGELEPATYKGYDLLRVRGEGVLMGVLDRRLWVIGVDEFVKNAIDVHKGDAKSGAKSSPLRARVKDLRDETFWFTADFEQPPAPEGAEAAGPPGMGMMMPQLDPSKIKSLVVSGKVTAQAFNLKAVLGCQDEDSAAAAIGELKQGVNMIAGMAGIFTGGDPDAAKAVGQLSSAIKISGKGSSVIVTLTITAELAEKLKSLGEKIGGPGGDAIEIAPPDMDAPEDW